VSARFRLGTTFAESNVHAPHHAIDSVEGFGHDPLDVSDEEAGIVGSDQLTPKGQVLGELLTKRATEPQGLVVFGRTVGFDRGSLAATCNPRNRDALCAGLVHIGVCDECVEARRAQAPTPEADPTSGLAAYPPGATPSFGG